MPEREKNKSNTQIIKQKIRDRYKGVSEDVLDVIPATSQEDFYKSESTKKVAVYARVSTDDPNQTSSYELQKNHYEDMVNRRANWILVDIYADEGISGTSLQHRDSFLQSKGLSEAYSLPSISDCVSLTMSAFLPIENLLRNIIACHVLRRLQQCILLFMSVWQNPPMPVVILRMLVFVPCGAPHQHHPPPQIRIPVRTPTIKCPISRSSFFSNVINSSVFVSGMLRNLSLFSFSGQAFNST